MSDKATPAVLGLSEGLGAWMPIATAPRDGTAILVFAGRVLMTRWYVHYMNGKPDPYRAPEWEQQDMFGGMGSYQGPLEPTHWMPLPAAPQSA